MLPKRRESSWNLMMGFIFWIRTHRHTEECIPKQGCLGWYRVHVVHEDSHLVGTRWVARYVENLAPVGTGSLLVQVHNGPLFHKLLQAHSRSPTFPGVGASAAPCPVGVRRTQKAPTAAARTRRSTFRSLTGGQTGVEEISQTGLCRGILLHKCGKGDRRGRGGKIKM